MNYIYLRCSTDGQEYLQQFNTINDYLKRYDISIDRTFEEKVSGSVNHKDRLLNELITLCQTNDNIYISELSRLGRNMNDLFNIISECTNKGVKIIQCKDGTNIESESIGGKALLFALSLAAEIELKNIRQRTKAGLDARKNRGQEIGGTKKLWGCNTGIEDISEYRERCIENATDASVVKRKEIARNNINNKEFKIFIDTWEKYNGKVLTTEQWQSIVTELNSLGRTTATGMEFTIPRAKSMYIKIKSIYPQIRNRLH